MPQIKDRKWIQAKLEKERPWSAYALADLEPGFFELTSWFCDPEGTGLTLLYRAFSTPLILLIGHSGDFESALDEIDAVLEIADRYLVSMPLNIPLLRRRYRIQEERRMVRMTLDTTEFRPAIAETVIRLTPNHLTALKKLYSESPPEFFLDRMLEEGIYFGIFEDEELIAAAGTHVLSEKYGIGGLGNIYTRKDRRSKGCATRVTSAVSQCLINLHIKTILLNVREDNAAAIHVYDRLGYRTHCRYFEMTA